MKKWLLILAVAGQIACGGTAEKGELSWSGDTLIRSLDPDFVMMTYPVAVGGKPAARINDTIVGVLKEGLADGLDPRDYTLGQLLDTMMTRKDADTILRRIPYDVRSFGEVVDRGGVISLYLQRYLFMGGAHGNTSCLFFNFDQRGRLLTLTDLFTDTTRLSGLNRVAFRDYLKLRGVEDPEQVLFVRPDELPLPQNVGFDTTGVVMLYNQYEIAPYSFGVTRYVIPYKDVAHIVKDILREEE